MSRSKKGAAAALAAVLLLSGTALADLIEPDQIKVDKVNYKTSTAVMGTLAKQISTSASEYYPQVATVRYEGNRAQVTKVLVKKGAAVKEGDPLLNVKVEYDEAEMASLEQNLERTRAAYEKGSRERQMALSEAQAALSVMTDGYERQVAQIQLDSMRVSYDQYCYQQERNIAAQQKNLDERWEKCRVDTIYADCDGVIANMGYFREGDIVYDGSWICEIANQDIMLVAVRDSLLRYGMEVTVETGMNKQRTTLTGHVVAAADCLRNVSSTAALVAIDPGQGEPVIRNLKVYGNGQYLDNVLLIARKAPTLNGGNYVVTKLTEDGITHKRNVQVALSDMENSWIIEGLEEGEVAIID